MEILITRMYVHTRYYYCEVTGIPGKVIEEAIIGNLNHLSKSLNLSYSCTPMNRKPENLTRKKKIKS